MNKNSKTKNNLIFYQFIFLINLNLILNVEELFSKQDDFLSCIQKISNGITDETLKEASCNEEKILDLVEALLDPNGIINYQGEGNKSYSNNNNLFLTHVKNTLSKIKNLEKNNDNDLTKILPGLKDKLKIYAIKKNNLTLVNILNFLLQIEEKKNNNELLSQNEFNFIKNIQKNNFLTSNFDKLMSADYYKEYKTSGIEEFIKIYNKTNNEKLLFYSNCEEKDSNNYLLANKIWTTSFSYLKNENKEYKFLDFNFEENYNLTKKNETIVGYEDFSSKLRREIEIREQKEILTGNISFMPSYLLNGPPGTGKTSLCKSFAREYPTDKLITFVEINTEHLVDSLVGKTEQNINILFNEIKKKATEIKKHNGILIILIDEINSLIPNRKYVGTSSKSQTNIFLRKFDELAASGLPIVLLSTTNSINDMDPAWIRAGRNTPLHINYPDKNIKSGIIINWAKDQSQKKLNITIDKEAQKTIVNQSNSTGATIKYILEKTLSKKIENLLKGTKLTNEELQKIEKIDIILTNEDILETIKEENKTV